MIRSKWAVVLLGSAAACVQTNAAVLDPSAKYQEVCPDAVVVYTSPERVGKPYKEVALLNSKGQAGSTSEEGMVNSQRKKAAHLGANGIILTGIDEPKPGTKIIGALLGTGAERKGKALAIYVPDDSLKTASTCGRSTSSKPAGLDSLGASRDMAAQEHITPRVEPQAQSPSKMPPGTNWIANSRTKTYYQVACPASASIPQADRLYYNSESSLTAAGFTRGEGC